jgi:hypothetical protein
MADLQAVLWYEERLLYANAKEDSVADEPAGGYLDDGAPDYANAAVKLARAAGVPEDKIQAALRQEEQHDDEKMRVPTRKMSKAAVEEHLKKHNGPSMEPSLPNFWPRPVPPQSK